MGRPPKQPVEQVEEKEIEQPVEQVEVVKPQSESLLSEISKLEKEIDSKRKEYSKAIADEREVKKVPTLAECIAISRRDDLNSDRRELKKVTAMAMDKLKKSK